MTTTMKLAVAVAAGVFAAGSLVAFAGSAVNFTEEDTAPKQKARKKGAAPVQAEPAAQKVELAATGDVAAGEKIYRINCAGCHGRAGDGNGVAASMYVPAPGGQRNAELMDSFDDQTLFRIVRDGDRALGHGASMPAFVAGLNDLDVWDIVAYMRTLHTRVDAWFPEAAYYIVKSYRVMSPERIAKATGAPLSADEEELKIFTVYRSPGHAGYAELVANEPGKLDNLKKGMKLGYLAFVRTPGAEGPVDIGIAMGPSGEVLKVLPMIFAQSRESMKYFAKFEGQGKRGKYETWKIAGVPPEITKEFYRQYLRMLESVFMFEKEEKDRTWMDED